MTWVNAVVQGILLGGYYALLACGLSLMFGVMRIINLAHGDIAVLGAYLILVAPALLGLPIAAAAVGWFVKGLWGVAVHTRNIDRLGPLEWITRSG